MELPSGLPPAFPKGLRVLLVDEEHNLSAIESQLAQPELQYQVTCANSSASALTCSKISGLSSFDIVLADARVVAADETTGKAFIEAFEDVPVVLMAEGGNTDDVLRAVKLGAVDFLDKPLSMLKLKNIWQHSVRMMMKTSNGFIGASPLKQSYSDPDMGIRQGIWGNSEQLQPSISTCLPSSMTAPMVGYGHAMPAPHLQQMTEGLRQTPSVNKNMDALNLSAPNRSSVDSPGTPSASDGDLADSISGASMRQSESALVATRQTSGDSEAKKGADNSEDVICSAVKEKGQGKRRVLRKKGSSASLMTSANTAAAAQANPTGTMASRPPLACKPSSFGPLPPVAPSSQWPQLEPGCAWGTPVGGAIPPPPLQHGVYNQEINSSARLTSFGITSALKSEKLMIKSSADKSSFSAGCLGGIECDISSGEFFKSATKVKSAGPLGLRLKKSDSLLDLINNTLSESNKAVNQNA